jgi:hypothetical protein
VVGKWKGTQKKCIDGFKNRCGAADSEGQRQDGHQRKSRALAESASRVVEVLPQGFDPTRYGPDADHVKV